MHTRRITITILLFWVIITHAQTDTIVLSQIPDTVVLSEAILEAYRANILMPVSFQNLHESKFKMLNTGQDPSSILSNAVSINSYSDAGNFSGYSYFRLRGMDQTRVNMTLDGIPLNEPEDQGAYFSNFPDLFNSVESVQIQRGVGTTSNGVASYAGSINFQSPDLTKEKELNIGANYGSFNTYRAFAEYHSGMEHDKALYARVSHLHSDGFKYHSGNTSSSVFLSGGINKKKHRYKMMGLAGKQKNELAWIGVKLDELHKDPRTNGNSSENDEFAQSLVSFQHIYIPSRNILINSVIYYNYLKGNYDFDFNNFQSMPLSNEMFNYAFEHNYLGAFSNIKVYKNNFKWYTGIHLNTFKRKHTGSERSLGELYSNNGHKNEISLFTKLNYNLGKIVLFGDIQNRHTLFKYSGNVQLKTFNWNFINPKAGVIFMFSDKAQLYYGFGINSREPTRNDIFEGNDELYADTLGHAIFADIQPEKVYDHEMGFRIKQKSWYLNANLFYMNFKNEIVLNGQYGPNGLPLHSNVAKSFRSGIEMELQIQILPWLKYNNASSFSYNRITEQDITFQPILSPGFIINQNFDLHHGNWSAVLMGNYHGKSYIDFENTYQLPAWFEISFAGGYQFRNYNITTGINNMTNAMILQNGYIGIDDKARYFSKATRNYYISLQWTL